MEISINRNTIYGILAFVALLSLLGMGMLGKPYTPVTPAGETRLLTWNDWQLIKAEQRYTAEREVLRTDDDALAALLNQAPDPVAAQILAQRVARDTVDGEEALQGRPGCRQLDSRCIGPGHGGYFASDCQRSFEMKFLSDTMWLLF